MSDILINVEHLSKKFCRSLKRSLWYGVQDVCAELMGRGAEDRVALREAEFLSLNDVSFQLRRGESLGLIGRNGAGKSTLLKVINGLIKPDAGRVEINGRIGALIELGAGFNPILTGRENIYINGAVLGFSKREIDRRLEAIIDFAELDEFIDAPLRSYSSGMSVRLGFAVAAQMEPDVLLIDEVLAVGDIVFRAKCYRRLSELIRRHTAIILVSHSSSSLLAACNQGIHLERGRLAYCGSIQDVVQHYENSVINPTVTDRGGELIKERSRTALEILNVCLRNGSDHPTHIIGTGKHASLCVRCQTERPFGEISLNVAIRANSAVQFGVIDLTSARDSRVFEVVPGQFELQLQLPIVCLAPGGYHAKISVSNGPLNILDAVEAYQFAVQSTELLSEAHFFQPHQWKAVTFDATESLP